MISNVDKLLLTQAQQDEIKRQTEKYNKAAAKGDTAAMKAAHQRAEEIRSSAGYSGGDAGDRYQLLKSAEDTPAGYNGYEALIEDAITGGMNAIAAGYDNRLAELNLQRSQLKQQGEQNQASARSAAWNQQRLADAGLLTQGLSNTGIAGAITTLALNQAAANAYHALMDTQNDLAENDQAKSQAKADALSEAADLQSTVGEMLADGYLNLFGDEADRRQEITLQNMKIDADKAADTVDYFRKLALLDLQRQWELEDRKYQQ